MSAELSRCPWPGHDPLMQQYHDQEWGVPVHDDRKHFEFLVLDAAQAGLSWRTVLHKRIGYRKAFSNFSYNKVATYTSRDLARLLKNPAIIRNRQKIQSAVTNAKALIRVRKECGTFDKYIWSFTEGKTVTNHWATAGQIPARTALSDRVSFDLKKRGFSFVGSTICYAYMQAAGIINDHLTTCFCYRKIRAKKC